MLITNQNQGTGFNILAKNERWAVAFKTYQPVEIQQIEAHLTSDECFLLKKGEAYVIYEESGRLQVVQMKEGHSYLIPAGVFHTNYLKEGAEVLIVENPDVTIDNSQYRPLSEEEISEIYRQIG